MPQTQGPDPPYRIRRLVHRRIALVARGKKRKAGCRERQNKLHEPMRGVEHIAGFHSLGKPDNLHGGFDAGAAAGVGLERYAGAAAHISEGVVEEGAVENHLDVGVVKAEHELRPVSPSVKAREGQENGKSYLMCLACSSSICACSRDGVLSIWLNHCSNWSSIATILVYSTP